VEEVQMGNHSEMLANEKIGRLLFKLSAPAIVGMIVQALYNLVDAIFIGRGLGVLAIGGIAIVFPIQMLIMAVAQTIGIGGASIISRSMGSGDIKRAEKTMGNVFSLVVIISVVVTVFGSIFILPILKLFGATENILPYSLEYLRIIFLGTIFFTFAMATNNVVRAEGNAKVAMFTMLISAGLNIFLDPIFIFGLKMGVAGAALATVIAQATTAIYLVYYFLSGKSEMRFHSKDLKLNRDILKETFAIGAAAFFRQVAGSIMAVILNNLLVFYGGDISIAVFGVINRLLMFTFMPMFGIVQGLQPIVGFNYGAKQFRRVKEAIDLSILITTIMSTLGFLILMSSPHVLLGIFNKDMNFINHGKHAIRIIVLAFPLIGFQIVGASMFQAIGKAVPSLILSMSRQILFFIPLVLILPLFFQLNGVWLAFPAADILSFLITLILFAREMKIQKIRAFSPG
jgi:putative MATE family efflux protein